MAGRRLRRLPFTDEVKEKLSRAGIATAKDLLDCAPVELLKTLNCSHDEVLALLREVAAAIAPKPCIAWEHLQIRQQKIAFLATGLDDLDKALRGGISVGTVTELVGPAGVGKTQFAMMLSVLAALPEEDYGGFGEDCGVLYFDTEGKFQASRLHEMARHKVPRYFDHSSTLHAEANLSKLLQRVRVSRVHSCEELMEQLERLEATVIEHKVRLVIVDSVAALVRQEFDAGSLFQVKSMHYVVLYILYSKQPP
jgi:RAD51-like protein 1